MAHCSVGSGWLLRAFVGLKTNLLVIPLKKAMGWLVVFSCKTERMEPPP